MCPLRNFAILKFCIEFTKVALFDKTMIKVGGRPMIAGRRCTAAIKRHLWDSSLFKKNKIKFHAVGK